MGRPFLGDSDTINCKVIHERQTTTEIRLGLRILHAYR